LRVATGRLQLAREGERVDTIEPVDLANAVEDSWQTVTYLGGKPRGFTVLGQHCTRRRI
jgi:hypothetical protein